jgi:hypothetical protein
MTSYRQNRQKKLCAYYTRRNYKKARFKRVEARAERWWQRTFGKTEQSE